MPWTFDALVGYDFLMRSTADSTRCGFEEEMATCAPCSTHASATVKPMPEEPPMTRMRVLASLDVYFVESDMLGDGCVAVVG
jgi:hypothetical protein